MEKEELEKLKDFKVYAFEWDVYVKAEDYKKIAIENKKLKDKIKHLEFDVDAWHQLKLLLEWEIEKLKEERDKYYAEWHLRHS